MSKSIEINDISKKISIEFGLVSFQQNLMTNTKTTKPEIEKFLISELFSNRLMMWFMKFSNLSING